MEHTDFTSVPGLAAKPILDGPILVGDYGDVASYAPAFEESGYVLREPGFDEQRKVSENAWSGRVRALRPSRTNGSAP